MSKSKSKRKVTITRLLLARVRCDVDHPAGKGKVDSWLRRLYVLWAATAPDGTRAEPFHLAQTDDQGYLSPLISDLDPHPETGQPLMPDVAYFFVFVRHPEDSLPRKILKDINGGDTKWGTGKSYTLKTEETGKNKGKPVNELVLRIPEDPAEFTPQGSELYKKWVLFRGMPGSGPGADDTDDVQCPPLREQTRRLQFHLGRLRYWVSNMKHPYSPQNFRRDRRNKKPYKPNEGIFDLITWNAVLAFQRHAKAGTAVKLADDATRAPLLTGNDYEPGLNTGESKFQIHEAEKYVAGTDAPEADAIAQIDYETVVDANTGDAVKKWLDNGLRKPGGVLIAHGGDETWMNSRALDSYNKWHKAMKELGFEKGISVSNVLRDPRIGIKTGHGMISTSIHKTGFALDLTMSWGKGKIDRNAGEYYPLYYEKDPAVTKGILWNVYALVPQDKIPTQDMVADPDPVSSFPQGYHSTSKPYVKYVRRINNFVYDPLSTAGGKSEPLEISGSYFLNVTLVAREFGFTRIPPHATGWQLIPSHQFTVADNTLDAIVARLTKHLASVRSDDKLSGPTFTFIDGNNTKEIRFKDCATMISQLMAWRKITGRHKASPELELDPNTKEDARLIATLRRSIYQFAPPKPQKGEPAGVKLKLGILADGNLSSGEFNKAFVFPEEPFLLWPITEPVTLSKGTIVSCPQIVGDPPHLEWWHHQWVQGYQGKLWIDLMKDIGWTAEGLLGPRDKNDKGIYGFWGVGYTTEILTKMAN